MRTTFRPVSAAQTEVWRGTQQVATIYATPGGLTIQASALDVEDVDIDEPSKTMHVELKRV